MDSERPPHSEHDRRWYPADDESQWVNTTRTHLFDLIQRCMTLAIGAPISHGIAPADLEASDDVFRHLHACTEACAAALYRLGQEPEHVVEVVLAGAAAAADPDELHPAVIGAISQWCRDAAGHRPPPP
jgi:hypothetical protein